MAQMAWAEPHLAVRDNISRHHQDEFALWSQQKATIAQQSGRLSTEITPITILQKKGDALIIRQRRIYKTCYNYRRIIEIEACI